MFRLFDRMAMMMEMVSESKKGDSMELHSWINLVKLGPLNTGRVSKEDARDA